MESWGWWSLFHMLRRSPGDCTVAHCHTAFNGGNNGLVCSPQGSRVYELCVVGCSVLYGMWMGAGEFVDHTAWCQSSALTVYVRSLESGLGAATSCQRGPSPLVGLSHHCSALSLPQPRCATAPGEPSLLLTRWTLASSLRGSSGSPDLCSWGLFLLSPFIPPIPLIVDFPPTQILSGLVVSFDNKVKIVQNVTRGV